ncbi:MAG: hypothetical protein GX607_06625 [Myxococcales bacterium]|nr:hypothetical protein [Myxococcales bacterium]
MRGTKDDLATEIPDLVVEPPTKPAATATATTAPAFLELDLGPRESGPPIFGDTAPLPELDPFGSDDARAPLAFSGDTSFELVDGTIDGAFELGLELEPLACAPPGSAHGATGQISEGAPAASPPPWPTGVTPRDEELPVVPEEIRSLAGFGAPPSFLFATPIYALRVWRRRRALGVRVAEARRALGALEKERDERVMHVAETARARLEGDARHHTLMLELRAHEAAIAEGEAALSSSAAELEERTRELERQLDELAETLRDQGASVDRARDEVRAIEGRLERVEGRHKRIEIERRALLDVARRKLGPAGGALPPEMVGPLAELDAREAALRPELEEARATLEAARARRDAAVSARELTHQRALEVRARRDAFTNRRTQELAGPTRALEEARARRSTALVELGRAVLAQRGHVPVDEALLEPLRVLDAQVRVAAAELQRLRLARAAYDEPAARRGAWILGLGAVAAGLGPFLL